MRNDANMTCWELESVISEMTREELEARVVQLQKERNNLADALIQGYVLIHTKAGMVRWHRLDDTHPPVTGYGWHKTMDGAVDALANSTGPL